MAIFGQPIDSIFGAVGLIALLVGLGYVVWGGVTVMSAKGKKKLVGGLVALAIGGGFFFVFGSPVIPGSIGTQAPTAPGQWSVCVTNANGATVGLGTCANSMVSSKAVLKSQTAPTSNYVVYFNITITPPSGANTASYNVIVGTGSVPSLTNTTNPSETAPVLGLNTGGTYTVTITPASGTATQQTQTVPITPGTSKVIAFQVKFSPIIAELSLGQYPVGVTTTYTIVDQSSGATYGTISLSTTFT